MSAFPASARLPLVSLAPICACSRGSVTWRMGPCTKKFCALERTPVLLSVERRNANDSDPMLSVADGGYAPLSVPSMSEAWRRCNFMSPRMLKPVTALSRSSWAVFVRKRCITSTRFNASSDVRFFGPAFGKRPFVYSELPRTSGKILSRSPLPSGDVIFMPKCRTKPAAVRPGICVAMYTAAATNPNFSMPERFENESMKVMASCIFSVRTTPESARNSLRRSAFTRRPSLSRWPRMSSMTVRSVCLMTSMASAPLRSDGGTALPSSFAFDPRVPAPMARDTSVKSLSFAPKPSISSGLSGAERTIGSVWMGNCLPSTERTPLRQ